MHISIKYRTDAEHYNHFEITALVNKATVEKLLAQADKALCEYNTHNRGGDLSSVPVVENLGMVQVLKDNKGNSAEYVRRDSIFQM